MSITEFTNDPPIHIINKIGIRTNIWRYSVGFANRDDKTVHPAPFPEDLTGDHILSWSNPGDLILDCFVGSGTTGKMALKYGRNFIGIDSSQQYIDIATKRLEDEVLNSYSKLFHV